MRSFHGHFLWSDGSVYMHVYPTHVKYMLVENGKYSYSRRSTFILLRLENSLLHELRM
jgi:hypothetical protein